MAATGIETVKSLYDAFGRRDVLSVFALLAPEVEFSQSVQLPWGGIYRGHAGAREFFAKLTGRINSTVEIERWLESGDHVTAIGWTLGTVNATRAPFRVPIVHVWQVREELVVRAQFLIDHPGMLAALRQ
jgi:ketosteroid isomerase-like protein